jgi:hypothetical protein
MALAMEYDARYHPFTWKHDSLILVLPFLLIFEVLAIARYIL